jgi:hypothetical protein
MTTTNRQKSLAAARHAVHFLRIYIESQIVDERIRAEITCLLDEFERMYTAEQARSRSGRPRIENPKKTTVYQRRWRDKLKS